MSVALCLLLAYIAFRYVLTRVWNIYALVWLWDTAMRPWRNWQNEKLRRLALPARANTLENISFGKCPGLVPSELCPPELSHVHRITQDLQAHHNTILGELGSLLASGERGKSIREIDSRLVESFGNVDNWRTIWIQFLHSDAGHPDQLPTLRSILDRYRAHLGLAFVSILPPHTSIPPHTGVLSTVLRYHYGLVIPMPEEKHGPKGLNMALNINEHMIRWQNRKAFIFDDTYVHCAFNHTDKQRIILFLDIIRPMPWLLSIANKAINRAILKSEYMTKVHQRMNC